MAVALPVAAGIDWIEAILPLLFLLFWIVSQVRALFGGAARDKPARPVVVRQPPRPPAADDEAHRELARQIEEFVRRSGAARPDSRASGSAAERRLRDAVTARPAAPRPRVTASRPPARAAVPPSPQQQPSALGSLGGHATDVARHVAGAFAHEIEHLSAGLGEGETAPRRAARTAAAAGIVAALRDPRTLRQLVIMREVLDRPVDRW